MGVVRYLILGAALWALPVAANIETYQFTDPAQEQLYQELVDELRCLVCQNQNLSGSNAELAQDLRRKTYAMVVAGQSREAILDYMVNRYGDFVLYDPPLKPATALLWVGPLLLLLLGLYLLIQFVRREGGGGEKPIPEAATVAEREALARAEQILQQPQQPPQSGASS